MAFYAPYDCIRQAPRSRLVGRKVFGSKTEKKSRPSLKASANSFKIVQVSQPEHLASPLHFFLFRRA